MSNPETPTQSEILARQGVAVTQLEQNAARLNDFMHNPAGQTVTTESGPIPTLAGLVEEIRQRAGHRRYEISWSVENLERYANEAEPFFRVVPTVKLYIDPALTGSIFRMAQPASQPIDVKITLGLVEFVVRFAANQTNGVVVSTTLTEDAMVSAGTLITCELVGNAWNASGFYMTFLALVEAPNTPEV